MYNFVNEYGVYAPFLGLALFSIIYLQSYLTKIKYQKATEFEEKFDRRNTVIAIEYDGKGGAGFLPSEISKRKTTLKGRTIWLKNGIVLNGVKETDLRLLSTIDELLSGKIRIGTRKDRLGTEQEWDSFLPVGYSELTKRVMLRQVREEERKKTEYSEQSKSRTEKEREMIQYED